MQDTPETPVALYRKWLDDTGRRLRADMPPPAAAPEAVRRGTEIRERMRRAEADAFLPRERRPALKPEILGTVQREGYRVERVVFQTRPGTYATATAYVPSGKTRVPGVLCVHGHWAGARRDPVVQSRCIGLAKLGMFALTLDAWGAGERGTRASQNEYHGGLLGASLWPVGTPLHGLQLLDNIRALDYLQSRPEVDPQRLGCTGASGGGNQTTYISAFDERIQCAVPVCSVGTFADYLRAACCVDEVLVGGLTFTEEGDLLGLVAPRALMVITATRDVYHFGPESSGKAVERARGYFRAQGSEERLRHTLFESGHDYSKPMREAMYGWMTRWLKGEGDGSPIPEPPVTPEDMEAVRCYPPDQRPPKVTTTVALVRERAEELSRRAALPPDAETWRREAKRRRERLTELLALPEGVPAGVVSGKPGTGEALLETEPGVRIPLRSGTATGGGAALLLHPMGRKAALETALARALAARGIRVDAPELRGRGELTLPGQGLGDQIPDHNLVEWGLWIGRPVLGQWVHDARQVLAALDASGAGGPERTWVVGWREAGLAALALAALDRRLKGVLTLEAPAPFRTETPPHAMAMAAFLPNLLLHVGDVPHLAALVAPRPVVVAGPLRLDGMAATGAELETLYQPAKDAYRLHRAEPTLRLVPAATDAELAELLR